MKTRKAVISYMERVAFSRTPCWHHMTWRDMQFLLLLSLILLFTLCGVFTMNCEYILRIRICSFHQACGAVKIHLGYLHLATVPVFSCTFPFLAKDWWRYISGQAAKDISDLTEAKLLLLLVRDMFSFLCMSKDDFIRKGVLALKFCEVLEKEHL